MLRNNKTVKSKKNLLSYGSVVRLTFWSLLFLLDYSLYRHQWMFAIQYAGLLTVTIGWLTFDILVLTPYARKEAAVKKAQR